MTDLPLPGVPPVRDALLIARPKLEVIPRVVARKARWRCPGHATADQRRCRHGGGLQNRRASLSSRSSAPWYDALRISAPPVASPVITTSRPWRSSVCRPRWSRLCCWRSTPAAARRVGVRSGAAIAQPGTDPGKPLWAIADEAALSAATPLPVPLTASGSPAPPRWAPSAWWRCTSTSRWPTPKPVLNYTFLHAGAHKVDGHPHAPLPAPVAADIQADIEQLHDAVHRAGRRVPPPDGGCHP